MRGPSDILTAPHGSVVAATCAASDGGRLPREAAPAPGGRGRHRMVAYARAMAQQPDLAYAERLTVPWWFWPAAVGLAAFAAAEVFMGADTALTWVPYAVFIPLTIAGLIRLSGIRVRVDPPGEGAELRVDDAHIPVSYITSVDVLDPVTKNALLGPAAAPHVFVVQRPWVREAVRVVIDDPADPTPYWVVSTRRPAALAKALDEARGLAA